MALKETISNDLKAAMKSGDKLRLETLRTLRATLMEKEIEKRGTTQGMSAEDEIAALNAAAKKRRESIEQFEKAGRLELVAQESAELAIILEYLPKQLSESEVASTIGNVAKEVGATTPQDFSKLMPAVMKLLKGKADGRLVQSLVKKHLGMPD